MALTEVAQRRCGQAAADVLTAPFVLGDRDELIGMFTAAGVDDVVVELRDGTMTFPTVEVFVETEIRGSPLKPLLDEESYQGLINDSTETLRQFRRDDGQITMPMDAFLITGAKRRESETVPSTVD